MKKYENLTMIYKPSAIITILRKQFGQGVPLFSKNINISKEMYSCWERNEIDFDVLPEKARTFIIGFINNYFETFPMTRQMAVSIFYLSTGFNRRFFIDKYKISEKTFYGYLSGEKIKCHREIDSFLRVG